MITKFCEKVVETYEMYGLWKTVLSVALALAIIFGAFCFEGWLLMVVLAWFKVSIGFWWCVAIVFVVGWLQKLIKDWLKGEI